MKSIKIFVITALTLSYLILFGSCKNPFLFEPEQENYIEVTPPEQPQNISIMFTENADTIYAWGNLKLNYSLLTEHSSEYIVKVYIDSQLLNTTHNDSVIVLNTGAVPDGYHAVKLELSIPVNSNSLADKLGLEFFYKEANKTICIDNTPPENPIKISVNSFQGSLRIGWEPYNRINFQEYKIFRTKKDTRNNIVTELIGSINDRKVNEFFDSTYLGDSVKYRIDLLALGTKITGIEEEFAGIESQFISMNMTDNENMLITWSKCRYEKNFEYYELYLGSYDGPFGFLVKRIEDINDTVYSDDKIGFGAKTNYCLATYSKPSNNVMNVIIKYSDVVFIGTEMPYFLSLKYVKPSNSIYLSGPPSFKLSLPDYRIEAEADGNITVSNDGLKAYKLLNHEVYEIDPNTLADINPLKVSDLIGNPSNDIGQTAIFVSTPNNYLFTNNYISYGFTIESFNCALIDIAEFKVLDMEPAYPYIIADVSSNGKYVYATHSYCNGCLKNILFKVNNGKVESNFSLPTLYDEYFCFDDSGDFYIMTNDSKIMVRKCLDNTIIHEYEIGAPLATPSVDPITGFLGGVYSKDGNSTYKVFNLNDGSLVKEIKILASIWLMPKICLINNTVFSSAGLYVKLD